MEKVLYGCEMCGSVVEFFDGFNMVCKGWDRHVFSMEGETDEKRPE